MDINNAPVKPAEDNRHSSSTSTASPDYITVVIFLSVLAVCLTLWALIDNWYQQHLIKDARSELSTQLYPYQSALSLAINRRLTLLTGVKAYVETEIDNRRDPLATLDTFSDGLMASTEGIKAVQILQDGIIIYTRPLEENKKVLNFNIRDHRNKQVREGYQRALETGTITLTGPVKLIQGGKGLIARQSIVYANDVVWGMASIVLELPVILEEAGFNDEIQHTDIAIRDANGEPFYGNDEIFNANPIIYKIFPGDQTWSVAAMTKGGWLSSKKYKLNTFRMSAFIVILCIVTLTYWILARHQRLTNSVVESTQQLSYQKSHDPLTGLLNRFEFERRLEFSLSTAKSDNSEHSLFYLTLDQLNVVNNLFGATAGDELLREISRTLKRLVRKRDVVGRLGGGKFAILMENCTLWHATRSIKALLRLYQGYKFSWEGETLTINAGVGLVPINRNSKSVDHILSIAHTASSLAKGKGGNYFYMYDENKSDLEIVRNESQWVAKINRAIDENRFRLYFQTIQPLNAPDGHKHYEILIRMEDDDGTHIPPGAFLPVAERYKLSEKIDRWVVRETLEFLHEHPDHLELLRHCGINLSGLSMNADMLEFIKRCLEKSAIPPDKVCFEVTETAAINNMNTAVEFINVLKSTGCKFALDDFGSGMSSFSYLKNLPVDYLKIDGCFVKNMDKDPVDYAMVKSINEIGKTMGKQTIAEFVENEEIISCLKEINVDFVQGYGIGKPLPIDQVL